LFAHSPFQARSVLVEINALTLLEPDVLAFVLPHQVIVYVPESFRFRVDGLSFKLVRVCLNGCLQHLLSRPNAVPW
jgi:hypothetical protein